MQNYAFGVRARRDLFHDFLRPCSPDDFPRAVSEPNVIDRPDGRLFACGVQCEETRDEWRACPVQEPGWRTVVLEEREPPQCIVIGRNVVQVVVARLPLEAIENGLFEQ